MERFAIDVLQHKEAGAWSRRRIVQWDDVVDLTDVRMIQRGNRTCLPLEAPNAIRVGRQVIRQHFDRDVTTEACVARAKDLTHATGPDGAHDFVRTQAAASSNGHLSVR